MPKAPAMATQTLLLGDHPRRAPTAVRIFKFGKIHTTKGDLLFDQKSAKSVMADWKSYGNELCFDYEHKAVEHDTRAGDGKAAGWFTLEVRDDGLWAVNIRWTPSAKKQIEEGEWRYFSPALEYESKTGRVLSLTNVALTNIPATKHLTPLTADNRQAGGRSRVALTLSLSPTKESNMPTKKTKKTQEQLAAEKEERRIAASRNASETTDEEMADDDEEEAPPSSEQMADDDEESDDEEYADEDEDEAEGEDEELEDEPAPAAKRGSRKASRGVTLARAVLTSLHTKLSSILGTQDPDEQVGAVKALKLASARAAKAESQIARLQSTKVKSLVDAAIKDGRLTPAQREQFIKMGRRSLGELKGFLSNMPKRVVMSHASGGDQVEGDIEAATPGAVSTVLSKEEAEVAKKLGTTELLIAHKNKLAGK